MLGTGKAVADVGGSARSGADAWVIPHGSRDHPGGGVNNAGSSRVQGGCDTEGTVLDRNGRDAPADPTCGRFCQTPAPARVPGTRAGGTGATSWLALWVTTGGSQSGTGLAASLRHTSRQDRPDQRISLGWAAGEHLPHSVPVMQSGSRILPAAN